MIVVADAGDDRQRLQTGELILDVETEIIDIVRYGRFVSRFGRRRPAVDHPRFRHHLCRNGAARILAFLLAELDASRQSMVIGEFARPPRIELIVILRNLRLRGCARCRHGRGSGSGGRSDHRQAIVVVHE